MSWRPFNETPEDIQREHNAAVRIEEAWGVQHLKLNEYTYTVDWAFFREGRLVSWAEFKFRSKRYDTFLLAAAKWMGGLAVMRDTGLPFYVFVQWPDGIYYHQLKNEQLPIMYAGSNRGQSGDKEPCVFIDTKKFILMKEPTRQGDREWGTQDTQT